MQTPLFVHSGTPVTGRDFANALSSLGIRAGSTLFVHSGLQAFGKLPAGMTREPLCLTLIDVLLRAVGKNGTVVMPTFNYAFCRGVPFNVQKSPSEVGTLSEFFRGERGVVRSRHPIFSVAAYGKRARDLTAVNMDSFGPGTFFANFLEAGGTFIFMGGATFCNSCTFIHQIERTHGVPYRFTKRFKGTLIDGRKRKIVEATHFVRPLRSTRDIDYSRLEKRLIRKKMFATKKVGAACICAVSAKDLFREGMQILDTDIYSLTKKTPLTVRFDTTAAMGLSSP